VPAVWINGKPGAGKNTNWSRSLHVSTPTNLLNSGKTVLTSLIIEKAQENLLVSVLFFYCKHKDTERSRFVAIARAILAQLLVQNKDEDLLPFLYDQSLDSGEIELLSSQLCNSLLKAALESLPQDAKIYLIIDGIDECEPQERRQILTTFSSLIANTDQPGRVRGLFVSQDESDIKGWLRAAVNIRITASDNEEDIKYFVDHWASKITNKFGLPLDMRDHVVKTVCHGADGK
jgi:hypothetical protein